MFEEKIFKKKVIETIEKFKMIPNNYIKSSLLVALSGGSDSVSLLHFLIENFKENKIFAAHVNHNLRSDESENDEKFVIELCKKYKIELFISNVKINEICKETKTGIEECSRNIRYDFFKKVSKEIGIFKIATAHTLSDSIETMILNLARGTGVNGICGIPPVRDNIIRPFIFVSKDELLGYVKFYKLSYVNDSSNLSLKYSRNKIRNKIIPILKNINSSFEKNCYNFIKIISEENSFLENIANSEFEKMNNNFNINLINKFHESIKKRIIKKILELGSKKVEQKHIDIVINMINKKAGSFIFSENIKVFIKNDNIILKNKIYGNNKKINYDVKRFKLFLLDDNIEYEKLNKITKLKIEGDIGEYVFRTRMPGDFFAPLNRNHKKKLKKFLNEIKIPKEIRNSLVVLANGSEIAWIESIGISDKYKIDKNIGKTFIISYN